VPLLAPALVTQTAPSPTATRWGACSGVLGSRTLATTRPVAGSTRTNEPSPRSATHSASSPAASSPGTAARDAHHRRPVAGRVDAAEPAVPGQGDPDDPTGHGHRPRGPADRDGGHHPVGRRVDPGDAAVGRGQHPDGVLGGGRAGRRRGQGDRRALAGHRVGRGHPAVTQVGLWPATQRSLPRTAIAAGSPNSLRVCTTRAGAGRAPPAARWRRPRRRCAPAPRPPGAAGARCGRRGGRPPCAPSPRGAGCAPNRGRRQRNASWAMSSAAGRLPDSA
jgi:hypothetical protein